MVYLYATIQSMARNNKAYPQEFWNKIKLEYENTDTTYKKLSEKYNISKGGISYNLSKLEVVTPRSKDKNISYRYSIGPLIRAKSSGYVELNNIIRKRKDRSKIKRLHRRPIGPKYKLVGKKYILSRIKVNPDNQCWEWTGIPTSAGYGQLKIDKVYWTSHRYSYTHFNGDIPEGLIIRHMCHNPICCNPEHLKVGTHKENYHDSIGAHKRADKDKGLNFCIEGVFYNSLKDANKKTGIDSESI